MSLCRWGDRKKAFLYSQKQAVQSMSLHTERSDPTNKQYHWQKSTWIFFSMQKINEKIISLLTDSLWRMRMVKHIILIIQYKLLTLLFQKALSSAFCLLFCSACINLKSWLHNGATDSAEAFSSHVGYYIHSVIFSILIVQQFLCLYGVYEVKMLRNVKNRRAQLWDREGATSLLTCRSTKPVARCSWPRIMDYDQTVLLNPYMCPRNFRGITRVIMLLHAIKGGLDA